MELEQTMETKKLARVHFLKCADANPLLCFEGVLGNLSSHSRLECLCARAWGKR